MRFWQDIKATVYYGVIAQGVAAVCGIFLGFTGFWAVFIYEWLYHTFR